MNRPSEHSLQQNNFCGVIGLLVVAGLWSAAMGSYFGLIVAGALLGILFTRAQWARIVSLVMVAYVGLVGLLAALFARGDASFRAMSFAAIAGAIFWLLLRPGMDRYFGVAQGASQVLPVAPRPGALPHLQNSRMAAPPVPAIKQTVSPVAQGSTQEQWTRLQQQLRAEQEKEREAAVAEEPSEQEIGFPWFAMVVTAMVFAYASSVAAEPGKAAMLVVIPGFIAAMLRWIHPRGFLLVVLVLSGGLILQPQWEVVAPGIRVLLQHHGPVVFAVVALLAYLIAVCSSGLADGCQHNA